MMTVTIWCLLIAIVMPIACAGASKSGAPDFDNSRPREWQAGLDGWRKRMHAAQQNCWEALQVFATAVLVAKTLGASSPTISALALAWVAFRLAYIWAYAADRPTIRSIMFACAFFCAITIFVSPVWAGIVTRG